VLSKGWSRGSLGIAVTVTAAIAAFSYTVSGAPYRWHDSRQYSRVIVNAQNGIEMRPRQWFEQDKLVTDFAITSADVVGWAAAEKEYKETRDLLATYGLAVGTYVSGTTVMPESRETHWPWSVVPLEWMSPDSRYDGNWPGMDYRKMIDVTDPITRQSFQLGIKRLWEQSPAPVRFIDNAAIHRSAGNGQAWSGYCANIEEIRRLGESMGSLQIFNTAMHIGELSDGEADQLIAAVGSGGILLEMPWGEGVQRDPAATDRARIRYRQFLDTGMGVILVSSGGSPPEKLVKWVATWRKPTDHLYFAGAFWKPPDKVLYGPRALQ